MPHLELVDLETEGGTEGRRDGGTSDRTGFWRKRLAYLTISAAKTKTKNAPYFDHPPSPLLKQEGGGVTLVAICNFEDRFKGICNSALEGTSRGLTNATP
nr:hypothetical protein [Cytophagales bacterium]